MAVAVHELGELGGREVAEVVHLEGEAVDAEGRQEVVLGDLGHVVGVDRLAEVLLGLVRVLLAVGGLPRGEVVLEDLDEAGHASGQEAHENQGGDGGVLHDVFTLQRSNCN